MKKILLIVLCLGMLAVSCSSESATVEKTEEIQVTATIGPTNEPTVEPTAQGPYLYTDYTASQRILDDAIVNEGNYQRILSVLQKAEKGEEIRIGVIGGSITWGSSADIDKTYAKKIYRWFKKKFPQSTIKLVNAGLSGTGSIIGAHRIEQDLLNKDVDLVVIEFAVNDTEEYEVTEAYENMIRNVLEYENMPGLMLLMMCADKGYSSEEKKIEMGIYYDLPVFSYKSSVYAAVEREEYSWDELADDFIHPDNLGHLLTAEIIISYLENVYIHIDEEVNTEMVIPEPLTSAYYTNSEFLTNKTLNVVELGGFEKDDNASWVFPLGYKAVEKNKEIVFEVNAKTIVLVYNQTIDNKGSNVLVEIDGVEFGLISSKSPFEWEAITSTEILRSNEISSHQVKLIFMDDLPDGCSGEVFKLLGVMVSR